MSAKPPSVADQVDNIVRQMRALVDPDQVVELRALEVRRGGARPCTVAGFFDYDHLRDLAAAALELTGRAKGVYFTLNPLKREIIARRANRVDVAEKELTKDKDVARRRRLLVDADPLKDAYISATDEEKERAEVVARDVRDYLRGRG
jgi:hypothetical protein